MNDFWKELKIIREGFRIKPASTGNAISRKRITLLVTDCLLRTSKDFNIIQHIPNIESCLWSSLKETTLQCDRLPQEEDRKRYGPGGYRIDPVTPNGRRESPAFSCSAQAVLPDPPGKGVLINI